MPETLTRYEAMTVRALLGTPGRHEDLSVWVRGVLTEIRTGSRVPPAIKHPLGFICVQLYRGIGWGLCMHIWRSPETSAALTTSPVHSHSWDLSSQVICGWLENIEIRVMDGSPIPTHRVLEITSANGCDFIRPTRRLVSYANNASAYIGAGGNYSLPAGMFHVSRPSAAGLTVTVLLAEDRYKSPELALGRLDSSGHAIRRRACPASDLRSIAGITLRDLNARSHGGTGQRDETR
jgi:hypothetical protein